MPDFFSLPVVCNTGPLIALSRAGIGALLPRVFSRVITTSAVVAELTAKDVGDTGPIEETLTGIEIVAGSAPDPLLRMELDLGEASVIQVARELGIGQVFIDERRARRIAFHAYGLEVRGTCAFLLECKRRHILSAVKPALDRMIEGGYFIGARLRAECLARAGES